MNILNYLLDNCPVRNIEIITPAAYTAAGIALSTHVHPIEALSYVFSDEETFGLASDFDTAEIVHNNFVNENNLTEYCTFGDLSEDFRLIGHLESITESIYIFLARNNLSFEEMNELFVSNQVWEKAACNGRAWVSSGVVWTTEYIESVCF